MPIEWRLRDVATGTFFPETSFGRPCVPIEPGDKRWAISGTGMLPGAMTIIDALRKGHDGLFVYNPRRRDQRGRPLWTRAIRDESVMPDEWYEERFLEHQDCDRELGQEEERVVDDESTWRQPVAMRELIVDVFDEILKKDKTG